MTKPQGDRAPEIYPYEKRISFFEFGHSFVILHSDFVIQIGYDKISTFEALPPLHLSHPLIFTCTCATRPM